MDIVVLTQCEKELKKFPDDVLGLVADAVAKLRKNQTLTMPLSRSLPSLGKGVHELRIKDKTGQYRVVYVLKVKDAIYLVHAFKKKTQTTPKKNVDLTIKRIKSL
jgi:phage-related protein